MRSAVYSFSKEIKKQTPIEEWTVAETEIGAKGKTLC